MSTTKTTTSTYGSVTAVDDTLSASQDASITYASWQILGNDIFVGFPNSDLSIASVTSVSGGSVVLNPDGSITFAPNDDFSGVASFTYVATCTTPRLIDVRRWFLRKERFCRARPATMPVGAFLRPEM